MQRQHHRIAIGIIRNAEQQIFLTQRTIGRHLSGYWEFPGGKLDIGETPEAGLQRELLEETGILVRRFSLLQTLDHHYVDRDLTLYFFLVVDWQGEPCGREGQPMRWVHQSALSPEQFPEANRQVITLLLDEC